VTLEDLPPLREVIAAYGLAAKKNLGQNFLLDLNLTLKIARAAGDLSSATVLEVGPGPGGLTRALLLAGARRVIAVERDQRCIKALQSLVGASEGKLTLHYGDALDFSLEILGEEPLKIIANLPYNIGASLLIGWLRQAGYISSMILMFQKEVAERITASPHSKAYGRFSVICQARAKCRKLFDVSPSAFTPSPKVTSSIVEFIPYPSTEISWKFESLEAVTQAAFGQRRKMLRSSLKSLFLFPEKILQELDLDPQKRAEDLTISDFIRLSFFVKT